MIREEVKKIITEGGGGGGAAIHAEMMDRDPDVQALKAKMDSGS